MYVYPFFVRERYFSNFWDAQKAGATWNGDGTGEGRSRSVLGWRMSWGCPRSPPGAACSGRVLSAQPRAAPSPLSCQLQAGSSQRDRMPVRGTEDEPPLSPPRCNKSGHQGGCSWQLELVNCPWVAPALALPRCEWLAVNPWIAECQLQIAVSALGRYLHPLRGARQCLSRWKGCLPLKTK